MADSTDGIDVLPPPIELDARPASYDRVPPNNIQAEISVLGAALQSPSAASEVVEALRPEDFYRSAHRILFEGMLALFAAGEPIDHVTLLDWLNGQGRLNEVGGASTLHALLEVVPTAANAAHYARIVREQATLRRLIDAGTEVVRLGYGATDDVSELVDTAESLIFEIARHGEQSQYSYLRDILDESFKKIELLATKRNDVTGLATGFRDLDQKTAGLQPSNLIILAARPSVGKTALALSIARHASVDLERPTLMFSLEMSKHELVQRLLSAQAKVDSSRLRTGRLSDADWRQLSDALGELGDASLFVDDTSMLTLMEIRAKSRRVKAKHGLDLIIVDYMQLMHSHRRNENRQQEVSDISRGLKMLAKELEVPVLALSQLSRQPEARPDKRPQLSDLRESGALEQDADLVILMFREDMYDDQTPNQGIVELNVAKHRNGPTGPLRLKFRSEYTSFSDLAYSGQEPPV